MDWWYPRRPASCAAMPALPSPRDLRRHLLLIHSVEMHLISIMVLIKMYFILIEILKNALFLQPLYFESRISKNVEKTQSVELYSYTAIQRYTVYSYTSLYTIQPLQYPSEPNSNPNPNPNP